MNALQASLWKDTHVTDWFYALSWLIWEGHETRIAVGEQEIWYVSQAWLEQRKQARALLKKHALAAQDSDRVLTNGPRWVGLPRSTLVDRRHSGSVHRRDTARRRLR